MATLAFLLLAVLLSGNTVQQTNAEKSYICVPRVKISNDAGLSPQSAQGEIQAQVQSTVKALATAGIKVTGTTTSQLSLLLTAKQVTSSEVKTSCEYIIEQRRNGRSFRVPFGRSMKQLDFGRPRPVNQSQALVAMGLREVLRNNNRLNGAGLRIGIISDSFAALPSAKTPSPCNAVNKAIVIKDSRAEDEPIDEGRAMAELVCFIVPRAQLLFHTAGGSEVEMASAIRELARQGARVIVDDIGFQAESHFSPGTIAQAIQAVASPPSNIPYFSSAGNEDRMAIDLTSSFLRVPQATDEYIQTVHSFRAGATARDLTVNDVMLEIKVPQPPLSEGNGRTLPLDFQWNEPFYRNTEFRRGPRSNLHIYVCDRRLTAWNQLRNVVTQLECTVAFDPLAENPRWPDELIVHNGGTDGPYANPTPQNPDGNPANGGRQDAYEMIDTWVPAAASPASDPSGWYSKYILIQHESTTGGGIPQLDMKIFWFGQIVRVPRNSFGIQRTGSWILPHTNIPEAMSIGAIDHKNVQRNGNVVDAGPPQESSSQGITPTYHDANGNAITPPLLLQKPDITAPDGTETSFFGGDPENEPGSMLGVDGATWPLFYGTSAAAPHAAAVAALMLQQNPTLQPAALYQRMRDTAYDMAYVPAQLNTAFEGVAQPRPGATGKYDPKTGYGFIAGNLLLLPVTNPPGPCTYLPNGTVCIPEGVTSNAGPRTIPWFNNVCSTTRWQCQNQVCTAIRANINNGRRCNDGNRCTVNDRCTADGICMGRNVCPPL